MDQIDIFCFVFFCSTYHSPNLNFFENYLLINPGSLFREDLHENERVQYFMSAPVCAYLTLAQMSKMTQHRPVGTKLVLGGCEAFVWVWL